MQHSPVKITDASGRPQTIAPFGRSWSNPEEDYRQSQLAKGVRPAETLAEAYSRATKSNNQMEKPRKMSLTEAFFAVYLEPVFIGFKMKAAEFQKRLG